jgi:hypothetical protein
METMAANGSGRDTVRSYVGAATAGVQCGGHCFQMLLHYPRLQDPEFGSYSVVRSSGSDLVYVTVL